MDGHKTKRTRTRPPRKRPVSTAGHSQPAPESSSLSPSLSAFSSTGQLFALVSLSVDKHRLRVYDASTGRCTSEYSVDAARVTALRWAHLKEAVGGEEPTKKKRKQRESAGASSSTANEVILLGLANGSVVVFSPAHGRVLSTLSHPASTSSILSIAVSQKQHRIWTSSADNALRLWDPVKGIVIGTWKSGGHIPYSCITVRPPSAGDDEDDADTELLAANHAIQLLSLTHEDVSSSIECDVLASVTGHASPVTSLEPSTTSQTRFFSIAESDRFVNVWEIPEDLESESTVEGKLAASIPLDAEARHIALSPPAPGSSAENVLLAVSASGKITIYPIPAELTDPAISKKSKQKVPTLVPRSTISVSQKKGQQTPAQVLSAVFVPGKRQARVIRLVGGVRPIFEDVAYTNDAGQYVAEVTITPDDTASAPSQTNTGAPTHRYAEPSSLAVRSGLALGQDEAHDDPALRAADGALDTDLAELTLGERLTALKGADDPFGAPVDSDSDADAQPGRTKPPKRGGEAVPANSLTRTLIQALHSSDARLLETCLAHSDAALVRNTVRRLPPQLAVPLLDACMERLGRGARAANSKGGGGGASSQRGMGLVKWVKAVLAVHSGHLMTMPDLVARLSALHQTLTARLALQESLLSLSGRLDMVLSQIEMRASVAPAPLAMPKGAKANARAKGPQKEVRKYVEGESEDEEENEDEMEVEVESGDDEGSVEDIELGEEDETDEEDEDEDDEDEDDESDDGEPRINGFIDDEAEEYSGDEDEDDESE
ncbi:WD40 repeat-like protein [Punctularia strigosozonata HHB-11173 SS5]|uniref:WD40 repeat-like protein n=1 Tax=Punctularia strigosozonata (strain HHB-11173) TaxID=741275 RepID=UPI0004416B04|nr:WD40 repeat-like protein [Punctularia strigosozonata HHB-11173 SS5]EIN13392.1 WD40 repeat-like protein [Punctularia strigosozonata HHB-11173 SS5]